jgi:hypothetical protein
MEKMVLWITVPVVVDGEGRAEVEVAAEVVESVATVPVVLATVVEVGVQEEPLPMLEVGLAEV